jgi:dockerin type I repeat protein
MIFSKKYPKNRNRRPRQKIIQRRARLEPLEQRRMLTVLTVDSLLDLVADDGLVTLREAIEAANTNSSVYDAPAGSAAETDLIQFDPALFTDDTAAVISFAAGNGQIEIADDLVIEGPGSHLLSINANGQSRVLSIQENVTVEIDRITISGGSADDNSGGGILNAGNLTLMNSTISGNSAYYSGGGICNSRGNLTIVNSTISTNSTISISSTSFGGGGIQNNEGNLTLINSTVTGNYARYGGGIHNHGFNTDAITTINSSTISTNHSRYGGGMYCYMREIVKIENTIIAGNTVITLEPDIYPNWTYITGSNNFIGSASINCPFLNGVDGNIVGTIASPIDPKFVDPPGGNFRLLPESPAIDSGNATLLPADIFDLDGDGDLIEPVPFDKVGNRRINSTAPDMGAYALVSFLSGDANLDGRVTTADLAAVTGHWQESTTAGRIEGDLNGSGFVNTADLAAVTGNWQNTLAMVTGPIADQVVTEGDPQPELIDLRSVFNSTTVLVYSATSSNPELVAVDIVGERYLQITYHNFMPGQDRTPAVINVTASVTPSVGDVITESDQFSVTVNLPEASAASQLDRRLLAALAIDLQAKERDDDNSDRETDLALAALYYDLE